MDRKKTRDDFTIQTVAKLEHRVGSRCSNPKCRAPTSGPHSDVNKRVSGGIAAHIHAAALNGPRYDPKQSKEERKAITNGVWLCLHCSTIIDRDPNLYPADLLREWKEIAESTARKEQGRPIESELSNEEEQFLQKINGWIEDMVMFMSEKIDPKNGIELLYTCEKAVLQSRSVQVMKVVVKALQSFCAINRFSLTYHHITKVSSLLYVILSKSILPKETIESAFDAMMEAAWACVKNSGDNQCYAFVETCKLCVATSSILNNDCIPTNILINLHDLVTKRRSCPKLAEYVMLCLGATERTEETEKIKYRENIAVWEEKHPPTTIFTVKCL